MKKQYIIPIFVPHLGCPNDCTFCNQKSISGQGKEINPTDVKEKIEEYLKNFKEEKSYKEIAFFGGSFTGIDVNLQEELLKVAYEYIQNKKIDGIRISTRPDYIDKTILKMLKKYKVKTIELGVQSSNDYILKKAKRGHTFADVKKASKLIRRYGFTLGHQMMIGLPDSTLLDEMNTAKDLAKLKPKIMRIYPVLVIKKTELAKEYENGEYEPLELNQAVERSKELCKFFASKKINIIRIGLQNTDTISEPTKKDSSVIAGPYHECFRQLVESRIWSDNILDKIKQFNTKVREVEVRVNPEDINEAVGYKKENITNFKDTYDLTIKIIQDFSIIPGKFEVKILKNYTDFADGDGEIKKIK